MIRKQLTMIYKDPDDIGYKTICFNSWKELHMHLFENGLYQEFQVFDDGYPVLHYESVYKDSASKSDYILKWDMTVPGSVLFEIVNRHASAKL